MEALFDNLKALFVVMLVGFMLYILKLIKEKNI